MLISGLTVIVAMAGMFLAGDQTFTALGVGAITVVLVAMIGSVTVVPAVLSRARRSRREGPRAVPRPRRKRGRREPHVERGARRSSCAARLVSAVAAPSPSCSCSPLPALNMRAVLSGTDDLPRNLPVMQVYDKIDAAFPGGQIPAVVTITGEDVTSPGRRRLDQGPGAARRRLRPLQRARST